MPVSLLSPGLKSPFLIREVRRRELPVGEDRNRIQHLASLIIQEIRRDPNRHVFQVLQSIASSRPGQLNPSDYDAIRSLQEMFQSAKCKVEATDKAKRVIPPEEQTVIPYANFAYQALIWAVRSWPKRDVHCHVGPSISEEFILEQIHKVAGTDKETLIRKALKDQKTKPSEIKHDLKEFLLRNIDWTKITFEEIYSILNSGKSGRNDAPKPLIVDLADYVEQVRDAVQQYFEDGVIEVHLGFGPHKELRAESDTMPNPLEHLPDLLNELGGALKDEEDKAEKRFGIRPRVYFIFDFNRKKNQYKPKKVEREIIPFLCRLKQEERSCPRRMYGIDIVGGENPGIPENRDYQNAIKLALEHSFQFASHLGDTNQASERTTTGHLEYFRRALEAMGEIGIRNWFIGHAKILANPIRRKKTIEWLSPEQQATVDSLLAVMQSGNIGIQSCPPSSTTIENLLGHPIFYWMGRGFWNISLGVDGVYYSGARSLSQWAANIMLASDESVTVKKIREMVDRDLDEASEFWSSLHPLRRRNS